MDAIMSTRDFAKRARQLLPQTTDLMYQIMSYFSLAELRSMIACGGTLKATAVAILDQDRDSPRWREELDAVLPGFAEKMGDVPRGTYRSLVALTFGEVGWSFGPLRPIESPDDVDDDESIDAWLREGVLIAVVRAEDRRSPDDPYHPTTLLFAAAWNIRDQNAFRNMTAEDIEPPSLYHRRVADAVTMRHVNDLVTLDTNVGNICDLTTSIFGLHPPSGALVFVTDLDISPFDDDDDARFYPILPTYFPQEHDIADAVGEYEALLPILILKLGIKDLVYWRNADGNHEYRIVGAPEIGFRGSGDVADYIFNARWVFNELSIASFESGPRESRLTSDGIDPYKPFAQYLAREMPLSVRSIARKKELRAKNN